MKKLILVSCFILVAGMAKALLPIHEWVKQVQGPGNSNAESIAVDAAGNVYITGYFEGTKDFDPGPGVFNLVTTYNNSDAFVAKYSSSGSLSWAKQFHGTGQISDNSWGNSIAIDPVGNVYSTGNFTGTIDFDPNIGTNNITQNGITDIFISKLDALGNFVYAKKIGGTGWNRANSIKLDAANNIYLTGHFDGTVDFNPGTGTNNLNNGGCFVVKLNNAADNFIWGKNISGVTTASIAEGNSIAVDASNNAYILGYFNGQVTGIAVSGLPMTAYGNNDVFISKISNTGSIQWVKKLGGVNDEYPGAIALDALGFLYITGAFQGTANFNPSGTFNLVSHGLNDAFVAKYSNVSGAFQWSKILGGPDEDFGISITADGSGNVYVGGFFTGTSDFDPNLPIYNLSTMSSTLSKDIFITKLNSFGNFIWASQMIGSNGLASPESIAIDGSDNIYTTGYFAYTVDFDPGASEQSLTSSAANNTYADIFVHKLSKAPKQSLDLTLLIEGYYQSNGMMVPARNNQYCSPISTISETDLIDVELRDGAFPYAPIVGGTCTAVLRADGKASCAFPSLSAAGSYYVFVKHRNAIPTCSANPISVGASPAAYNFTTAATQAYGLPYLPPIFMQQKNVEPSNAAYPNGLWAFYSGDLNYDENIDLLDSPILENDILSFAFGCIITDLDGDGSANLIDLSIQDQNITYGIYSQHPW